MEKELIKQAATEEEAKALIAAEFGVEEDKICFEVLQPAGKKVLGLFGGSEAKVKGVLTVEEEETAKPETVENKSKAADMAKAYLEDIIRAMGVSDFTCTAKETENGCMLSLDGEKLGFIIGHRGDTLDALQYLTGLVANRADNAYCRVTLDIGNYREKREQTLIALANRIGKQTARTGRRHSLEPMNPYERRVIHTAIQSMEGVTSWSVGTEPNRHVVIGLSDDPNKNREDDGQENRRNGRSRNRQNNRRGDRRDNNRGERREHEIVAPERPVREFISRSNPLPMADGATPPARTESEKETSASLYGRIDL